MESIEERVNDKSKGFFFLKLPALVMWGRVNTCIILAVRGGGVLYTCLFDDVKQPYKDLLT